MKRNRPHTPVTFESIEQRTFLSVTAAPPLAEIAPTPGFPDQRSDYNLSGSSTPEFIQPPFMHQLHGPADQSPTQPAPNVTSITLNSASTSASSQNLSQDSNPVAQSMAVNAPLSDTAIRATDSSPIDQAGSQAFVADWSILNDVEPVAPQQPSGNFEIQSPAFADEPHDSAADTTAQPNDNDSNDFQALLTYLRQNRADETGSGMFSQQRLPALHEISAGKHSILANAPFSKIQIHASQAEPSIAPSTLKAASAQSPSQTMLESLTPNWWVWATSLIVLAVQRLSSRQRPEENPKNQFQFLSANWKPDPLDPRE